MSSGSVERRRGRRARIQAPIIIRPLSETTPAKPSRNELAQDVSLAGVYFETDSGDTYAVNDVIMTSISVPESSTRAFPFTRLAGRSRVVRVSELPSEDANRKRFGIALEFGDDLTVLTALPARG